MTQHRRATVEIDLAALRHNASVAKRISGSAQVMSAIKANAYGHGMVQAALALKDSVDEFAVASIDDVLEIRQDQSNSQSQCNDIPITVLSGFYRSDEIILAANNNASLVVYDDHQIDLLIKNAETLGDKKLSIWVKIDTGMSRLGLSLERFESCIEKIEVLSHITIRGIVSHFANADEIGDTLNQQQLQKFQQLHAKFQYKTWHWSIANSAALLSMSDIAYDWVRPGIMLYGSSPFADKTAEELELKPVMTFSTEVISIRQVKKGRSVGYGSTWVAEKDTTVAVIACGYGDGYPRVIAPNTPVLVNGQRTIILGRVSMDLIVVDVSHVNADIGSSVVLWGKGLSVDEIAMSAGTIAYELLCSITGRVERYYINEINSADAANELGKDTHG